MSAGRTNLDQWMERPPAEAESRTELLICPAIGCVCAIVTLLSAGNLCTCNDRDQSYLAAISLSTPSFGLYLRCPTYRLAGKHRGARRPASPPARGARGRPGGGGGRPKRTAPATAGPARGPLAHAMNGRGRSATPRPGHRAPGADGRTRGDQLRCRAPGATDMHPGGGRGPPRAAVSAPSARSYAVAQGPVRHPPSPPPGAAGRCRAPGGGRSPSSIRARPGPRRPAAGRAPVTAPPARQRTPAGASGGRPAPLRIPCIHRSGAETAGPAAGEATVRAGPAAGVHGAVQAAPRAVRISARRKFLPEKVAIAIVLRNNIGVPRRKASRHHRGARREPRDGRTTGAGSTAPRPAAAPRGACPKE